MRIRRKINRLTWQIIRGASGDCGGGLKASVVEVDRDSCGARPISRAEGKQQALLRGTSRRIRMKDRVDVLAVGPANVDQHFGNQRRAILFVERDLVTTAFELGPSKMRGPRQHTPATP